MEQNETVYSSEERILAALAHAAIMVPSVGLLAPLGIWITQREKSAWVRFQALQALAYQMSLFVVAALSMCLTFPISMAVMFAMGDNPGNLFFGMVLFYLIPAIIPILMFLLGLFGGMMTAFGKDFRYPILGGWVRRRIEISASTSDMGGKDD